MLFNFLTFFSLTLGSKLKEQSARLVTARANLTRAESKRTQTISKLTQRRDITKFGKWDIYRRDSQEMYDKFLVDVELQRETELRPLAKELHQLKQCAAKRRSTVCLIMDNHNSQVFLGTF